MPLLQLLQKGFHVTLGATASLVETLQDPEKRSQSFARLQTELGQLTEEWAEKGSVTEQEARNFVETVLNRPSATSTTASSAPDTPAASPEIQVELQELTAQIAAMRAEVEKLRSQE